MSEEKTKPAADAGPATPDQVRAAQKRADAAKAAAEAAEAAREQLDERAQPPKGRRASKGDEG